MTKSTAKFISRRNPNAKFDSIPTRYGQDEPEAKEECMRIYLFPEDKDLYKFSKEKRMFYIVGSPSDPEITKVTGQDKRTMKSQQTIKETTETLKEMDKAKPTGLKTEGSGEETEPEETT